MELTATEAQQLAFDFLMEDLNISPEDREWFAIYFAIPKPYFSNTDFACLSVKN